MKERTHNAFCSFREQYPEAMAPSPASKVQRFDDDCVSITVKDGLKELEDGSVEMGTPCPENSPLDFSLEMDDKNIYAVLEDEVVYALERCEFGNKRSAGMVKHTNLTSGANAYAGGELRFLDKDRLIINGKSGRYPVPQVDKLAALGRAFLESGYHVCCMGFDAEAGLPFPLGSVESDWIG